MKKALFVIVNVRPGSAPPLSAATVGFARASRGQGSIGGDVSAPRFARPPVAVAARSAKPEWSKALLAKGPDLAAAAVHIYPGDKRTHLRRIAKGLGCAFSRMVLFDDARAGRPGNCVGAAALGGLGRAGPGWPVSDNHPSKCCSSPSFLPLFGGWL